MKKLFLTLTALVPFVVGVRAAAAAPSDSRLQLVRSFAFGIGDGALSAANLTKLSRYDLVVIDGEGATEQQVTSLRDAGVIVLAYLSVGTVEKERSWFQKAKRYRLELWEDWREWYADTSKAGFRKLIVESVVPRILAKGFDGLFLDNVDMAIEHRPQRRGMFQLLEQLSGQLHQSGKFLFAQNGFPLLKSIGRFLDGWNREDVSYGYDFDRKRYVPVDSRTRASNLSELRGASARGLLVLATDYLPRSSDKKDRAIELSCSAGAIPFVSDIFLRRIAAEPFTCPSIVLSKYRSRRRSEHRD